MATTSLNPGVGPTNADIATAVAAPSAATIAAAVAAPSAATIAAAVAAPSAATIASTVAAPSSATIATAVAAAVPTISAINTAVANNAPSPNNWVYLGNGSLVNVNTASVSFSAYKKLRIVWKFNMGASAQAPLWRFNGDTGSNYTQHASIRSAAAWDTNVLISTDSIRMTIGNMSVGSPAVGWMEIYDTASTTAHKQIITEGITAHSSLNNSYAKWEGMGVYRSNTAITSVSVTGNGGTNFSNDAFNSFQVFGAN
jgi:hypothetical protein